MRQKKEASRNDGLSALVSTQFFAGFPSAKDIQETCLRISASTIIIHVFLVSILEIE